jgi:hypothetical protein
VHHIVRGEPNKKRGGKYDLNYMVMELQEVHEQKGPIINRNKSEHTIFGNNEKKDLPLENDYINGIDKCKHLGVLLTKTVRVTKE